MPIAGVHVELIYPAAEYTQQELDAVCRFAYALGRGRLVLTLPPKSQAD